MQPTHVRKRDGRLVAFDLGKLSRSIKAALTAANDAGAVYSDDIAYAIAMHLGRSFPDHPPRTGDISAAVAKALEKAYSHRASAVYLDYRVAREEQRSKCQVVKPLQISLLDADSSVNVMSGHEQNSQPWNRVHIIRALEQEAHVPHNVAETIAQSVENRILSSGLSVVTTTLIRALTDSELLAHGYANALRQRSSVTIPYEHLERALDTPEELGTILGAHVSIPFALSHIYSEDVAMAHRQGLIGIGGLRHPFARHFEHYEPLPEENATDFRRHWAAAARLLSSGLCEELICDFSPEFLKRQPRERLFEIHDTASVLPGPVTLALPLSTLDEINPTFTDENITWLFCGEWDSIQDFPQKLQAIANRGCKVAWSRVKPPSIAQIIGINLPQRVYKKQGIEEILLDLRTSLEAAVHAHRQYRLFAQARGRLRISDIAACEIIGLREAVSAFCGESREERFKTATAILQAAREIVSRLAATYYFDMRLTAGLDQKDGRRFSTLDQRLFPELFGFGFLPFGADESEALRHAIPPYQNIKAFAEDSQKTVALLGTLISNHCDGGRFDIPAECLSEQLLEELLVNGFPIRILPQKEREPQQQLDARGQTFLL